MNRGSPQYPSNPKETKGEKIQKKFRENSGLNFDLNFVCFGGPQMLKNHCFYNVFLAFGGPKKGKKSEQKSDLNFI